MEVQSWTVFANLRNMSTKLDIKERRKFNTTFLIIGFSPKKLDFLKICFFEIKIGNDSFQEKFWLLVIINVKLILF